MKRIYNDIPLRSVLYLIGGNQRIKVRNYHTQNDLLWNTDKYTCEFDGLAKDFYGYRYSVIEKAKVHRIDVLDDGSILFSISTAFEQF